MISDQVRMEFRLEQHKNFDPQGTNPMKKEEEEEEEGLGIWRTCFTPSQCKELKAYYFQWMNRLQRQAVERVIKESERTTERAHENNSSQGETDHLNACYLGHYMPWISAQHHVMQRFITNHCLCCEGLFMMNLIYFIIVELCHFVYRTKSNLYIAFFFKSGTSEGVFADCVTLFLMGYLIKKCVFDI